MGTPQSGCLAANHFRLLLTSLPAALPIGRSSKRPSTKSHWESFGGKLLRKQMPGCFFWFTDLLGGQQKSWTCSAHLERCLILRRFFCNLRVRFLKNEVGNIRFGFHPLMLLERRNPMKSTSPFQRIALRRFFHFQRNFDLACKWIFDWTTR